MKISTLCAAVALALGSTASAATINFSGTATSNRIVTTAEPFAPAAGGTLVLGTMSNEADFTTFTEFGRSSMGSNAAFSTGVVNGTSTNNTSTASNFASKPIYLVIYTEGNSFAGIYKSTASFDATISGTASQTFNTSVANFTTAINPTTGWDFLTASVNPQGFTGSAGNPPADRTGVVFDLGQAVPEPTTGVLSLLALGAIMRRRR